MEDSTSIIPEDLADGVVDDSSEHPETGDNTTIPTITVFNVCDDDDEHLHEDELDGGVWKGPPLQGDEDDLPYDPIEVCRCPLPHDAHCPEKYTNINGVDIPPARRPQEYPPNFSGPSTPMSSPAGSHNRRGSMKLVFPKLFHWRKLSDQRLKQVRNQIQRLSIHSATSTNVVGQLNPDYHHTDHHQTSSAISSTCPNTLTLNENYLGQKRLSVDSVGILKHNIETETKKQTRFKQLKFTRKAVSFSQRDNDIQYYDTWISEEDPELCVDGTTKDALKAEDDGEIEEELGGESHNAQQNQCPPTPLGMPQLSGKSLVPVFVFPGKRPTYAEEFKEHVLMLESLEITEDFCLMGNIRINMTKLRAINQQQEAKSKSITVKQRASVYAIYTFDSWKSYKETKAMVVNAVKHPALKKFDTHAMRFYIDCDDMDVGDTVEFSIWCADNRMTVKQGTKVTKKHRTAALSGTNKDLTTVIQKYRDDNEGNYYKAKCTKKLNPWAEKAARELKNFTPIVKSQKNYV